MANEDLAQLESKLEQLKAARGTMNDVARVTEMKKIRKLIRAKRDPSEVKVKEKKAGTNKSASRAARKAKREANMEATGHKGPMSSSPMVIIHHEQIPPEVFGELETKGLLNRVNSNVLYNETGYAFAFVQGETPILEQLEEMLTKFHARWGWAPRWFGSIRQGVINLIAFGPVTNPEKITAGERK